MDTPGRNVDPLPYTGGNEQFTLNITPEEIRGLKDGSGEIRFHKVMEFLLPRFDNGNGGEETLWEWQAAQMRSYMKHIIHQYGWKLKYYGPFADKKEFAKEIEAHYVCRLYGVMMARIFAGDSDIDNIFSGCKCFDAIGAVKEYLTQNAFKDLY